MRSLGRLLDAFDRWLLVEFRTSRDGIACARVLFAAYVLLVGAHDFSWVSTVPDALFLPAPGPLFLLSGFPPAWVPTALRGALVAAAFCLLGGIGTQLAALSLSALLVALYGLAYSMGKATHNVLYVVAPLLLAFTGCGTRRPRYWPISVLAFLLAFLMLTAGLPKMVFGWLDPSASAVRGYALEARVLRAPVMPEWALAFTPWELLDWSTIAFECSFAICVWRASWFRVTCAVAVIFHALVFAMLDISFASNIVAYAMFFDWTGLARSKPLAFLRSKWSALRFTVHWRHCGLAAAAYAWLFEEAPLNRALHALGVEDQVAVFSTAADVSFMMLAAVLSLLYLASRAWRYARSEERMPSRAR